ncbi:substrate-binding domain-containing protein [Schlegelella sp. S2-27]|uniref:Substrate-binding domain-containing protein n=2 Tax=Caldimonas mangrovi TaxID=2944811 RepID=A0ABT0YSW4_9BURK|nr:substrate-binding domain-containing protein [Caldimonas mangrovi]MCM5681830.1 substrate-binding domain-containing protein [Caldimonas mangrovi]
MATRQLLAALGAAFASATGQAVHFESVGGVDAARRVRDGEAFDIVVLASDALDGLAAEGHVLPGSIAPMARSPMAVAVRAGAGRPDIGSEQALKQAVLAAGRIGYSTGPSGAALLGLLERWGLAAALQDRLLQARPGIPVAQLIAAGEVELGFQQLSELMHVDQVDVLGTLPAGAGITTVFSAAVCARTERAAEARALLDFMRSPETAGLRQRCGMR